MAMQRLEDELRKTGDPQDQLRADAVAKILKDRGKDILLRRRRIATPQERILQPLLRFSDKDKDTLRRQGLEILKFNGESVRTLAQKRQSLRWGNDAWDERRKFQEQPSRRSEVAIVPGDPFIPGASRKTLREQYNMLGGFLNRFEDLPDVEVVQGSAAEYAELAFAYSDITEESLFGHLSTRTTNYLNPQEGKVVVVGEQHTHEWRSTIFHLDITWGFDDLGRDYLSFMPLFVPKGWSTLRYDPARKIWF